MAAGADRQRASHHHRRRVFRGEGPLSTAEHGFVAEAARALPGPQWLVERRLVACARFAGASLPTEAEEVWRYSRIGELDLAAYDPPAPEPPPAVAAIPTAAQPVLDAVGPRAALVVTANGHVTHVERGPELETAGGLADVAEAGDLLDSVAWSTDALSDLATAFTVDAAVVAVPARATLDKPVVVVHELTGAGRPAGFPRTLVHLGEASEATVVEVIISGDGACYLGPLAELLVEDAAQLHFHSLHRAGAGAFEIARQASRVGRDASLVSLTVSLGGDYARCRTDSVLAGQGGSSRLLAAYLADGTQMQDFRTLQEHAAPKTSSDLLFKGAVAGSARSVYSGLIRMRHGARGSDALQTNRNLVLSEGAHADSVPNLDIEENDVRCSHASAVGPIDPDQRYYLESRGVPPAVADRLILGGFFEDLFERAPAGGLRDHLPHELATRLAALATGGDR